MAAEVQIRDLNFSSLTITGYQTVSYGFTFVSCTKANEGWNLALALLTKACSQARKAFWNLSLLKGVSVSIYRIPDLFVCSWVWLYCLQVKKLSLIKLSAFSSWLSCWPVRWSLLFSCSSYQKRYLLSSNSSCVGFIGLLSVGVDVHSHYLWFSIVWLYHNLFILFAVERQLYVGVVVMRRLGKRGHVTSPLLLCTSTWLAGIVSKQNRFGSIL